MSRIRLLMTEHRVVKEIKKKYEKQQHNIGNQSRIK